MFDLQDFTKNRDNTISMDYTFRGSLYKIKILDRLDDDPDTDPKTVLINRILLAKKQKDKYWELMRIHVLNYRIEQDQLFDSDHRILIDTEDYSLILIDGNKNKLYEKMCDSFLRKFPEDGDFSGYPITLEYPQFIYYFYQWIAKKKTIAQIANCEIR